MSGRAQGLELISGDGNMDLIQPCGTAKDVELTWEKKPGLMAINTLHFRLLYVGAATHPTPPHPTPPHPTPPHPTPPHHPTHHLPRPHQLTNHRPPSNRPTTTSPPHQPYTPPP